MDTGTDIVYSWNQNNKVTLYLLENIKDEWLSSKLNNKGRSIGEQFLHINNIRSFWVNKVGQKIDLKIDKKYSSNKVKLIKGLNLSASKMSEVINEIFEKETIKGFKPHPNSFFC